MPARRQDFPAESDATLNRFNKSGDATLVVSADYLEVVMARKQARNAALDVAPQRPRYAKNDHSAMSAGGMLKTARPVTMVQNEISQG